jgi:hypothetical protein
MRFLPLILPCALLFALPAKADKFWFSDPETQKNAPANSAPDMLEGVLVAEDADTYTVRIVGGEVVLAKKSVVKVEKDGLTVEQIGQSEKAAADGLAAADKERALQQDIARKERELRAAEASAKKSAAVPADASARVGGAAPAAAEFDPVLGVAPAAPGALDLLRATQAAYELTGDRAYLRALRQLRRLR